MEFGFVFVISGLLCSISPCHANQTVYHLEAEDVLAGKSVTAIDRRKASNGQVVMLHEGGTAYFDICINSETRMRIVDVRYATYGEPCEFSISLQGETLFHFQTETNRTSPVSIERGVSSAYNKLKISPFRSRPKQYDTRNGGFSSIPKSVYSKQMRVGRFRLDFKVHRAGRKTGLEIDFIKLSLENDQSVGEFTCKVYCLNNINFGTGMARSKPRIQTDTDNTPYILQKSYETVCAEEDNINIPIVAGESHSITITATFPKYQSFSNERTPDFENCAMVSALWTFEDIIFESDDTFGKRFHKASLGPKHTKHIHGDVAALVAGINAEKMMINIQFKMEGRAIGVVDADIGSRLFVKLRGITKETDVSISYRGRYDRWFKGDIKTFSEVISEQTWHIPDHTWSEHVDNYIHVHIHYPWRTIHKFAEIEKIELSRRYKRPTRFFHMHNNGKYLMEGADIDFWWLINQTMTVRILDTGEVFPAVDYFRIYSKIPWSRDLFSQVFVIYQDGNVRLLPVSPHGIDWVPFGSSILIGQSETDSPRPSSSIKHVDISMNDLVLHIYYRDGGYVSMQVIPNFLSTVIKIHSARFPTNPHNTALLTFRSMWVANGNADVDHVSVDGNSYHVLTDDWKTMKGHNFAFFRKCISKHNSLSPDIVVEIDEND